MARPTAATFRRRRLTALAVLVGFAGALVAILEEGGDGARPDRADRRSAPPARELPGGGRRIFPDRRVVAFYGSPRDPELGSLGVGTPRQAAVRLQRRARGYGRRSRPVLPALELISTLATSDPGDDGQHRLHAPASQIGRYLREARRIGALLILDIQPGLGDFLPEVKRLERWLREPDVGLALDPEWQVRPGQVPGRVIGSTTAAQINAASSYLAGVVARHRLPEKLLVVHQFTDGMVVGRQQLRRPRGVAVTMNVDGFGTESVKVARYHDLQGRTPRLDSGFKLFFNEDSKLMRPAQVLGLRPPPDLVVFE